MGAIIMCSTLIAMALFFVVFSRTKAGKRFFADDNQ
jgi:branched-subunit amino acid ABC-type transport system permease component